MYTGFSDHIYNFSENVSDLLLEHLNEQQTTTEALTLSVESRSNPKITFLEQRIAALEGGVAALAVKSFNKAKLTVIKSLLRPGDNVVTFNSYSLFYKDSLRLNRAGIEVRLPEDGSLDSFKKLLDNNTKLIYLETISREYMNIPDYQKISIIAKEHNIPVLADNSAAGAGYLTNPLRNGANLIIDSTRSWLPSHRSLVGALIIDGGTYHWQNGKFPHLALPGQRKEYNTSGIWDTERGDHIEFSIINYLKKEGNINLSSFTIPPDPLSLVQDLDHLPVRIQRQSDNALALAQWLSRHPLVKEVNYTGLPSNPSYFKALTFFRKGFGAALSFSLKEARYYDRVSEFLRSNSYTSEIITAGKGHISISVPPLDFEDLTEILTLVLEYVNKEAPKEHLLPNALQEIF